MSKSDTCLEQQELFTFRNFILSLIEEGRTEYIKRPSKNYQKYITLLHKLEKEGYIQNKPLSKICNADFIAFGRFVLRKLSKEEGRTNYVNLMKLFKMVHTQAYNRELNDNILRYPYIKDAPVRDSAKRISLTPEQYSIFCNYDLKHIKQHGCNVSFYKELYRDFCMFLYEMKMRPCDVLRLHCSNIHDQFIVYTPEKKKNYLDERKRITYTPITKEAARIIDKYKGKSTRGYVFPFSMNDYDWNFNDAESWNRWHNRKQKVLQDINTFLHKFEEVLDVRPITLYSFRHSAFTHAINSEGANIMKIAKEGATSIDMLEGYYYHL